MKFKRKAIPWLCAGLASLSPLLISIAEEPRTSDARAVVAALKGIQVPRVPEGTKITEEITKASQLIESKLINPINFYSNQFARMSRAGIRRDTMHYNYAFTDTSESLLSFDVYRGPTKIASGVCHPGMETVKVAMPETGVMVDPEKHPSFAGAMGFYKKSKSRIES